MATTEDHIEEKKIIKPPKPDNFVHLHVHSEYSLLDGACRLPDLIKRAQELGMRALALTDHGVMYGVVPFYKAAKKAGIKPIIGCEVYMAAGSRFDRGGGPKESNYHLTLLAADREGYQNLMRLVSAAFIEGFYYRPRIDRELLEKYHHGLIALSGCMSGQISRLISADQIEAAKETAVYFRDLMGPDNFYLEIQNQKLEGQDKIRHTLADMAAELQVPLAATNDVHFLTAEDHTAQDVLLCIQTGSFIDDGKRLKLSTDQFYLKSGDEMAAACPEYPEALANTLKIAERCRLDLELGGIYLPDYEVPKGYSLTSYLEELCRQGLKERYGEVSDEINKRFEYELGVIDKLGFSGYFLIVWDFINFAKRKGIRVGPGRGSAAGSIVAYALGITSIDPLKHDLLFERFLNPERVTMPDIDIDFCYERRNEVLDYVTEKYGRERVAQIITFGTMMAKQAIRDAGRVFGIPYGRVDRIAKLVPNVLNITLKKALETAPDLELAYETDDEARRIIDAALKLEGMARHDSVHAAGVVISREALTTYTPLQQKPGTEVVTQYPMEIISEIGLLKMDFLGLRTLTVIDHTLRNIKLLHNIDIDLDKLDENDAATFALMCRGETVGVFQLESSGMRALVRDLKPSAFADIVALLALYRPGPLQSGMVKDFCDYKNRRKQIKYIHPLMEPILKETHGIIVYQEQVMRLATEMAGFTMAEADILRGAMSKKKSELLDNQEIKFIEGAVANGVSREKAVEIFRLVNHFAGYGFNKSHSTAYAVISYQTAYLKCHYPVEFMAALMTSVMSNKDKIAQYVNECRRLHIEVRPPNINESRAEFTPTTDKKIVFGLAAVKNVGGGTIQKIIEAREKGGPFHSIFDFCARVDSAALNKRALESLIKSGAFDSLGVNRRSLLNIYEQALDYGQKRQRDRLAGQFTFFDQADKSVTDEPIIKEATEMSKEERRAQEKEVLGLYVSDNPLLEVSRTLNKLVDFPLSEISEHRDGERVVIGGIISNVKEITTRKNELMLFATIEDLEGSVEAIIFSKTYRDYMKLLVKDNIIIIKGRLDIKDEEVKIIAGEIKKVSPDRRQKKNAKHSLCLSVSSTAVDKRLLEKLKKILSSHPGPSPVYLQLRVKGRVTTLKLPRKFLTDVAASQGELVKLLGSDAVTIT